MLRAFEGAEAPVEQLARLLGALLAPSSAPLSDHDRAAGRSRTAEPTRPKPASSILPVFSPSAPMSMASSGLRFMLADLVPGELLLAEVSVEFGIVSMMCMASLREVAHGHLLVGVGSPVELRKVELREAEFSRRASFISRRKRPRSRPCPRRGRCGIVAGLDDEAADESSTLIVLLSLREHGRAAGRAPPRRQAFSETVNVSSSLSRPSSISWKTTSDRHDLGHAKRAS